MRLLPLFLVLIILITLVYLLVYLYSSPTQHIERIESEDVNEVAEKIIISTCACGKNILPQAITLLKSIALFSTLNFEFFFITDDLGGKITEEIRKWPEMYRKRIDLKIVEPQFPNPEWKMMYHKCASARIFLPEILSNVDSLIHLDVNNIFLSPVEELWKYLSLMDSTQMLGIVRESYHEDYGWFHDCGHKTYKDIPFIKPVPYNSRVLLMNLTRLRNTNWSKTIEFINIQYKEKLRGTADQGLINIFLNKSSDSFIDIPCHWNYMDEHCIFDPHMCESAQTLGIGLFHHHSHCDDVDQSNYSVYEAFNQFSMTNDSMQDLFEFMKKDIMLNSKCKELAKIFSIGYERLMQKIKNKL